MKKIFVTIALTLLAALALTACAPKGFTPDPVYTPAPQSVAPQSVAPQSATDAPAAAPATDAPADAPVAPTAPASETPLYDAYLSGLDALDMEAVIAEALENGYPEELNWLKNPSIFTIDCVADKCYYLRSDGGDEYFLGKQSIGEAYADGATLKRDNVNTTAKVNYELNAPARLEALAQYGRRIAMLACVTGLEELDYYVPEGGGAERMVYTKLVTYSFIDVDTRRLLAWLTLGYEDEAPASISTGSLEGANNDVFSRGYAYNALDMLAYTSPECGLGGGTFSDGEFLVVNGALLKYYGSGGTVKIPDGVTFIPGCNQGRNCFEGRSDIKKLVLNEGLLEIGEYGFNSCNNLSDIEFCSTLARVGSGAFSDTKWAEKHKKMLIVGDGLLLVGGEASGELTIPDGVKRVGCEAFVNQPITKVKLPDGILELCDGAFVLCKIEEINLPEGLIRIGERALAYCKMESVVLPESLTEIGRKAFDSCSDLKEVRVPKSVTWIGELAFADCAALTDAYIGADTVIETPTATTNEAFYGCAEGLKIHCSKGSSAEEMALRLGIKVVYDN